MTTEILTLQAIEQPDVGGKAYGLSRLLSMGLAVPPAFVIRQARAGNYPADLLDHYRALGAGKVAVRSSAVGEDGQDASFAGQYDTVLNVEGESALQQAIDTCVASVTADRARSYLRDQGEPIDAGMNIVVQRMVDARAAGVVFTADPVSARRDLLVIDAVAGLGEALVSGEATPDHYAVDSAGTIIRQQLVGALPLLSTAEITTIAREARQASQHEGQPLDLEWAIDQHGQLFWLQARPITTLPADLNEFDTTLPRPDDVLTISNISEMMPGAVSPLTGSFTGWGIDYGLQHMQVTVGARDFIDPQWQLTGWAYGHLFLNLTGSLVMSAGILGSDANQTAQSLCGRIVPELKDLSPRPLWQRCWSTLKLLRYCLTAPRVVDDFTRELAQFQIKATADSLSMVAELLAKSGFYNHCMAVHIQSSALSGFCCSIVENMVSSKSNNSTRQEQAEAIRLLSGATGVESAVMLEQLDQLVDRIAEHADAESAFQKVPVEQALAWLQTTAPLDDAFACFLRSHGHRGYRELCMRDNSWCDDPSSLIQSMQAAVHGRLSGSQGKSLHTESIDWSALSRGLRWALPKAHDAIRRREKTKSQLADLSHRFKRAFRHLGELLEAEGKLPDADLVCFFSLEELPEFVANPTEDLVKKAIQRREALDYQQQFQFAEISVGMPQPLEPQPVDVKDGVLQGRPASRGVVEGIARVAHTLQEAAALQPGEILVTPITDIGWTPYFSLIAGLVTDLGSSVSHGAVIAREYGLPCVVNTRQGTRFIQTGDRLKLDGDNGCVTLLERAGN